MRTVLSQGEQSNQNMLPCYDEAGKQRVSEAGKGQVHTGHTTVHLTPTSGPCLPLAMAPCCLTYQRATWGVMFWSLVLKHPRLHTPVSSISLHFLAIIPHYEGGEKETLDIFSILKILRDVFKSVENYLIPL